MESKGWRLIKALKPGSFSEATEETVDIVLSPSKG
jgi:hypothetical protein